MKEYIVIIVTYILYGSITPHLVRIYTRKKKNELTYAFRNISSVRNNFFSADSSRT